MSSHHPEGSYEEARKDLLMLLRRRQPSHVHSYTGTYECYQCFAGKYAVVLAWLGVDADLDPIVQAGTKGAPDAAP